MKIIMRKNVSCMTACQRKEFIDAIHALKKAKSQIRPCTESRYDDYVFVHLQSMSKLTLKDPAKNITADNLALVPHTNMLRYAHNNPSFLPWHRAFLYRFEKDLQEVSGNSELAIPYWDWSRQQDANDPAGPWTDDFMGGDGNIADGAVETGPFRRKSWPITIHLGGVDYLTRRFGRTPHACMLPKPGDVEYTLDLDRYDVEPFKMMNEPMDMGSNDDMDMGNNDNMDRAIKLTEPTDDRINFRSILEGAYMYPGQDGKAPCTVWYGMHDLVHQWIGGTMGTKEISPNDPIFFLHHANVDRIWAMWQTKYPGPDHYVPAGHAPGLPGQGSLDDMIFYDPGNGTSAPWSGWPATPSDVLDISALGYQYEDPASLPARL